MLPRNVESTGSLGNLLVLRKQDQRDEQLQQGIPSKVALV